MQNFRPFRGKWVIKEHTLKISAGAVEPGDFIMITSGGITVELATNAATALIGISVESLATSAATQSIRVLEPVYRMSTFVGPVTDGAIAVGDTDSGRTTDFEDHEGIDTDTDTHHHVIIVKGRVATADGATTAGEGEFRLAQGMENLNSF